MDRLRFIRVIILAVKRERLQSKLNIWWEKKTRKYPPRINEFEVVCLSIWGLIQEPDPRARQKRLFAIIQEMRLSIGEN